MEKTILIVEDNELNMKLFNDLLRANGFRTLQTNDGVHAIHVARLEKPDLILMDICLQGKMDGIQAAMNIRHLYQFPLVFLTAY